MATPRGVSSINLLPKDSFQFSAFGRGLKWATTAGRVLVVMTEFVVILAFASRFYFDKRLNDLTEEIDQKIATIKAYEEVETKMRIALLHQKGIAEYLKENLNLSSKIESLAKTIPLSVTIDKLSFENKDMSISGTALSEIGFSEMIQSWRKDKTIKQIQLDKTSYDQQSGMIKFSLKVNYI